MRNRLPVERNLQALEAIAITGHQAVAVWQVTSSFSLSVGGVALFTDDTDGVTAAELMRLSLM
jgi:hypothetical protein